MNPHQAYNNIFKNKKKFISLLLLISLLQFLFLLVHPTRIKVPNSVKNLFISILAEQPDVKIGNVFYNFPNHIDIEKLLFLDEKTKSCVSLHDLSIDIKSVIPNTIKDIGRIHISKIIYSDLQTNNNFNFSNLELLNYEDHMLLDLDINYHSLFLNVKGDLNFENLKNIILTQKSNNKYKVDYNKIRNFIQNLDAIFIKPDYTSHYDCYFSLQNKLYFNVTQKDLLKKSSITQGLQFFFSYDIAKKEFDHINLLAKKIIFSKDKINYNLINFRSRLNTFTSLNNSSNLHDNFTNIENVKLSGLLSGQLENLSVSFSTQHDILEVNLFIDSNKSTCSNNIIYNPNQNTFLLNGFNEFIPHLFNLQFSKKKGVLRFVDGNKLSIFFRSAKTPILSRYINQVYVRANQFSVNESPPGDYEAYGYLDENVSVIFDYVYGHMGDSVVSGKFSQRWHPLNYNFKIKGYCIPKNINAWLGDWWDKIWLDFNFNKDSIPFGYFDISGIWNDKSSNKTFGAIYGENLAYKGLPITKSHLNISVDRNKTRINSSNSLHKFGKLSGFLSIPRNEFTTTTPMTYSMSGVYPLNDGKMALGNIVEEYLNDFNISKINIDSKGQFPISKIDNNKTFPIHKDYSANFSSSEKGSWNGIEFDEIKGVINADNVQFDLRLPVIKMGEGLISVNLLSKFTEEMISLNVEIKNAKVLDLYNSAIAYQNTSGGEILTDFNASKPTDTGLIDLSLNTSGNSSDLMSFKGTGMIKLQDKQLSKVQLLGFISKGLSELPLPFPNGTLNFNKLEGLFELENGKILFDQLALTGLLSRIISKGSFDLITGELDILSKIQIIGNIPIPIINQIAKLTDPLSIFAEIKISGNWQNPKWKLSINPLK